MNDLFTHVKGRDNARITLPSKEALWPWRDSIITLDTLSGLLSDANHGIKIIDSTRRLPHLEKQMVLTTGHLFWCQLRPGRM